MEPIYLFIAVLSVIAARLIYDSTIATMYSNRTLNELKQKNTQLKNLFNKINEIQKRVLNPDEIDKANQNFELLHETRKEIYETARAVKPINQKFQSQIQRLPRHLYSKMFHKLSKIEWLDHPEIQQANNSFFTTLKLYIMENYQPTNIAIVKFTDTFFLYEGMEIIRFDDGTELNKGQVREHLEKINLNEKLHSTLPPRPKTKINKI